MIENHSQLTLEDSLASLRVRRLFLWRNKITDIGALALCKLFHHLGPNYPLYELHLSHNRITSVGADKLLEAIKASKAYPRVSNNSGKRDIPLWLRLEYNYIDYKKTEHFALSKNIKICMANQRHLCSSSKCGSEIMISTGAAAAATAIVKHQYPEVHLYVFEMQYLPVSQSRRLQSLKKASSKSFFHFYLYFYFYFHFLLFIV